MSEREQGTDNAAPPNAAQSAKDKMGKVKAKFKPGIRYTLLCSLIFFPIMFIVGVIKTKDCPANDNIPLFLIATGALGLFSKSISAMRERLIPHFPVTVLESSLYTAEIVFLILGSYWTFKIYKPSFDERDFNRYCNKTAYMFAFIYLIVIYAFILVMILGFCCFLGCIFFVAKQAEENGETDQEAQQPIQHAEAQNRPAEVRQEQPTPTSV